MKLLLGRRYLILMNWRRRLWPALGVRCVLAVAFIILMLMITTMAKFNFCTGRSWFVGLLFPMICDQESKSLTFILDWIFTWEGLLYPMLGSDCIIAFMISFGVMFTLTSYLLLLSLRLIGSNRKRVVRRRRVRSSLWTRRKVF